MSDLEKDPVVHSSLGKPLAISSALLVLSLVWALYDEAYATRPWKGYQKRFVGLYSKFLKQTRPSAADVEAKIKASSDYKKLDSDMQAAEAKVRAQAKAIDDEINLKLVPQQLALNEKYQELRSEVGALTYQIEITSGESSKNSLRKDIEKIKQRVVTVKLPNPDGLLPRQTAGGRAESELDVQDIFPGRPWADSTGQRAAIRHEASEAATTCDIQGYRLTAGR